MRDKIFSRVTNGQLSDMAEVLFWGHVAAHEGKDICIYMERKRRKRSLNQNAFFHGPFIEAATEMFLDKGNDFDQHMTKEIIKDLFGPKQSVTMPDGRIEYKARSSADWTTGEAEEVMEKARAWASGYGYKLPFPNEDQYGQEA